MSRTPILVTGSTRSGTSWVGKMLCISGEAGYVNEPFNQKYQPGWAGKPFPYHSLYINTENQALYEPVLERILQMRYPAFRNMSRVRSPRDLGRLSRDFTQSIAYRMRGVRPLLKDPYAIFSAEWLAQRFNMNVVVTIRHPAGFVSSIKKLNWKRNFQHWVAQESLLRDHLAKWADQIRDYAARGDEIDIIDCAILMWNCYYDVVHRYRQSHPDWLFVNYEELAEQPVAGFHELYGDLGLHWSGDVEGEIREYSSAENPKEVTGNDSPHIVKRDSRAAKRTWRTRLTDEEIERVRTGTHDVFTLYYPNDGWPSAGEAITQ